MSYFISVVLPSVGLPEKPSFSIPEACQILCCGRKKLSKLASESKIVITQNKRIYKEEFIRYFEVSSCQKERNGHV